VFKWKKYSNNSNQSFKTNQDNCTQELNEYNRKLKQEKGKEEL